MDYKEITSLIKLISKSNLSEFKLKEGEFEISIRTDKYFKQKEMQSRPQPIYSVGPQAIPPVAQAGPPATDEAGSNGERPENVTTESPAPDEAKSEGLLEVKSPIVGTFYRAPAPDKPPYVKVGDQIDVGSVVCIVEAMKLFNEIESEVSGKIVKVLADDATPVEYDQILFLVDPNA